MENASKALLISVALLIVIWLIAAEIKTLNSSSKLTEPLETDSQIATISAFNAQFTPFIKNSASPNEARAFIQKVISHNSVNSTHPILINYYLHGHIRKSSDNLGSGHQNTAAQLRWIYNQINNNKEYMIYITSNCGYYDRNGYDKGYIICMSLEEK